MSVEHVARAVEQAGIATVGIYVRAFRHVAEAMFLARTVVTRHPMGRPLGAPRDHERHREVLSAALGLLQGAREAGTVVELEAPFRPGRPGA